ncbi:transcriptional regulator TetR family [Clostridium sp. CAG:632]|nr:transcriptional regulator TetR family [Clostridium sp. CAG:632]
MSTIRESTVETRKLILKSAEEIFLECGYQEASMRKIAAKAGITPGAIYKHFSNKEEMFGEIFADCGNKLMSLTESMINVDFAALSDEQLLQVWQSRVSVRTFHMLEGDMRLFHMLLNYDSGGYMERFRKVYIDRSAGFAVRYYDELYKRGLVARQLRPETIYMLSMAEFTMICEMIADDSCKEGITPEMEQAFQEAMDVLMYGLEAGLGFVNKEQWKVRR